MPTAEESEALKTPSREVKTLIDSVLLSAKLNSSILSCQVINNHMSKYTKLPCSWRSKNYGFEFLKSIDFVAREEVMQTVAYAGIINGRGFKTETRYNDVILIPL